MKLPPQTRWIQSCLDIAVEWNSDGVLCHLVEPLGAFARGSTEHEALDKARAEYSSYLRWLEVSADDNVPISIVQRHETELEVQDADSDILLAADLNMPSADELEAILVLLVHSAASFELLFERAQFPDRVDTSRTGTTFYGERPDTVRKVYSHVDRTQDYYMSRLGMQISASEDSFVARRADCARQLRQMWSRGESEKPVNVDNERWTFSKVCRRFLWHDRIHAKCIVRILRGQVEDRVVENFVDPFHFFR